MRAFVAFLLALTVLAGCSSEGSDDEPTPTGSADPTTSPTGTTPPTGSPRPTGSPTGSPRPTGQPGDGTTTVDFKRTNPNGPVPLNVNVTIDAAFAGSDGKPATPSGVAWGIAIILVKDPTGADLPPKATEGPSGTSLPATATVKIEEAGTYALVAFVAAEGYGEGNATIEVIASPSTPDAPKFHFYDGGESDASQWTLTSKILIGDAVTHTVQPTEADHPTGGWEQSDAQKKEGAKSWFASYPDNYRGTMTSVVIDLPAPAKFTFQYMGGAEGNAIDGLRVLAGPEGALVEKAFYSGPGVPWTKASFPIGPGKVQIAFQFDSDFSCSNDTNQVGDICAAGFDAGGYYIDEIMVA